ncbi:AAA family ATPase [Bacillus cereus]|uniref:AAA family ATPase n=1 Tax=Bacillus cereus TaxID=1396 RepID=UPI003A811E98
MFIKKIEITSFRKLKNFNLDFSNTDKLDNDKNMNLTIIIGENGTAKTTVFEAIMDSFLNKEQFSHQDCTIEYKYRGKDFISNKKNAPIPKKIIVSTYTPIDKLNKYTGKSDYGNVLRKTNIDRVNLQHISTRILKHYVFDGQKDIDLIFKYIGYKNRNLILEISPNKLNALSEMARNAIARLYNKYEDVSYLFEDKYKQNDLDKTREVYQKELILFKENLARETGREIRVGIDLEKGRETILRTLRNRSIYSRNQYIEPIYEICVLEILFVLYKMKILFSTSETPSQIPFLELEGRNSKFFPINRFRFYHGGPEALRKDLKLLELCSISFWKELHIHYENGYMPLSMLSSGELSLFLRLFDLYDYIEEDSIILIDEPETHLHPRWIKGYVKILNQILGEKRCHVIIATHSPLIVSDVPKDSIIALKNNRGFIEQIKIRERTLGLNYDEVLSEVFGLDDDKGNMVREYAKLIEKALEDDEFDKALAVYSQMADSDIRYKLYSKLRAYQEQKGERDV